MDALFDFSLELQLRPAKLLSGSDVPHPFLECQIRLQDNNVLSPTKRYGLCQYLWGFPIHAIKIPHSPQIPGENPVASG